MSRPSVTRVCTPKLPTVYAMAPKAPIGATIMTRPTMRKNTCPSRSSIRVTGRPARPSDVWATPSTMVRKMIGAMIIRTRFTKVSPSGFIALAVSGTRTPSSTPSAMATRTRKVRFRPSRAISAMRAHRSRRGGGDDGEPGLDPLPIRLLPGGELQRLSQRGERLVHGEPRLDGRQLEEHPAGLPEVDRLEVVPIQHLGHFVAQSDELLPEAALLLSACHGHRHMVHRSEPVRA